MSKIIRFTTEGPRVFVGDKRLDFDKEKIAQSKLSNLFPNIEVITDADGAKFIPIQQVNEFERQLKQDKKISYDDGYKNGYDVGLKEGLQKAQKVLSDFENAIKSTVTQRESLLDESREQVLELVIKICRKISYGAIEVDPERTLKVINGVINTLIDRSHLKIKVNPQHLPIVEQHIAEFSDGASIIKSLEIIADPRVKFGGCFIETPTGDIDARLCSQIDVIEDLLKSVGEE